MKTLLIRVYGIVQGVGFRPTVSRHAAETHVRGSVCNKGPYVEIWAAGTEEELAAFLDALEHRPPERSSILKLDVKEIPEPAPVFQSFEIIESEKTQGDIFVSPDIAICDKCKEELFDPKNRRYLHPFINCTCCGPRLTILDAMPYDRVRTSMGEFPMCPECAAEYTDPKSRRYDAQPVCCNQCGPEVYLIGRPERGRAAILATRKLIHDGCIVAIKGIGGFHLCCDAENQAACQRLRDLKQRPQKPFAVMMKDLKTVRRHCTLTPAQEEILDGHQKPIILLDRKAESSLCDAVAPENPRVGVMLPYAPIQLLLFSYDDELKMPDALVMTSGNTSGAPICRDDADAVAELSHLCDAILSHNRTIRIRADDSVMDFYRDEPYMIRRSRGYAPLPFMTSNGFQGSVLAVGGELKNTFCIGCNDLFYPSPYIGDMGDLRTVKALRESITRMETLLETKPALVACDLHPKYNTTAVAQELGLPVFPVQHHYAHILSCMAENDHPDPVIGISLDGTGYGTDGTIWGGELLRADYRSFERLGHIESFLQVGGDLSAKEGWRIALSLIHDLYPDQGLEIVQTLGLADEGTCKVQFTMAQQRINAVTSTSAGRLFDGVSAILGIRMASTFEGEASTALQFAAEAYAHSGVPLEALDLTGVRRTQDGQILLATDLLVRAMVGGRLANGDPKMLAWQFHQGLADQIVQACEEARADTGLNTVALSGGCYQNRLLLDMTVRGLEASGFQVLRHRLAPPNDGGIALGQAVAAMEHLQSDRISAAMRFIPPEAAQILTQRFGRDCLISLATAENDIPYVRTVNGYYEDGAFYILTDARSNKMHQLAQNSTAALAGEWFTAHGVATNLGFFGKTEHQALAAKLRQVFSDWIDNGHLDLTDPNTCILRIQLTDAVLFSNGTRYDLTFAPPSSHPTTISPDKRSV